MALVQVQVSDDQLAAILAAGGVVVTQEPATEVHPFVRKMQALRGQGGKRPKYGHVRPLAIINTLKGRRAVYLVTDDLKVYTCKYTNDGFCYKPGMYDGRWSQPANELAAFNE